MDGEVLPYLTGWIPQITGPGFPVMFKRGEFTIEIIGKHDILVSGKGFSGEMRFYDAARKVMELDA